MESFRGEQKFDAYLLYVHALTQMVKAVVEVTFCSLSQSLVAYFLAHLRAYVFLIPRTYGSSFTSLQLRYDRVYAHFAMAREDLQNAYLERAYALVHEHNVKRAKLVSHFRTRFYSFLMGKNNRRKMSQTPTRNCSKASRRLFPRKEQSSFPELLHSNLPRI